MVRWAELVRHRLRAYRRKWTKQHKISIQGGMKPCKQGQGSAKLQKAEKVMESMHFFAPRALLLLKILRH